VFVSVLLPIVFCAVVFVVVLVVVTSPRYTQFLKARVDVAVAPVLCAVEIRRLAGAIRLLCQMVGISKFSSGRQVAYANN
jgi:sensor domain CHASE-containing protein